MPELPLSVPLRDRRIGLQRIAPPSCRLERVADQRGRAAHPAGDETQGGASAMIHDLTIGYLDPVAIHDRMAVALKPLDDATVGRVLAEFPGLKVERRDGYLIAPWHGREDGARGEAFAARIQAETGCLVADRRNGRIVELERGTGTRAAS